ncbi:MAG: hypothetical protein H6Q89_5289 [Myxococcaceae bacterium]|nr:hypothetical protein [Myxococcaceae bacterium]
MSFSVAAWLVSTVSAHVVPFVFLAPDGVTGADDGGRAVVRWLAGPDPTGAAEFSLYASRDGTAPFARPRYDATVDATSRPAFDGLTLWNTRGLSPGCYQPFAEVNDLSEGISWRVANGVVVVAPTDAGNVPPALWVLSPANEPVLPNGNLPLRYQVLEPDDPSSVSVFWGLPDGGGARVAGGLAVPPGGTVATVILPAAEIPAGGAWLRFEVLSADGRSCSTWWGGRFEPKGQSAADDGGTADGGAADAGDTKGQPRGCGCGAGADSVSAWLALVALGLRRKATAG